MKIICLNISPSSWGLHLCWEKGRRISGAWLSPARSWLTCCRWLLFLMDQRTEKGSFLYVLGVQLKCTSWPDWFWTAIFLSKIIITLYSLDTSCRSILIYTAIHYCFLFPFNIDFSILLLCLPTSLHNMLLLKLPSSPIFVTNLCLAFLHRWTQSAVCSVFLANCFPNSATVWQGIMSCSAKTAADLHTGVTHTIL